MARTAKNATNKPIELYGYSDDLAYCHLSEEPPDREAKHPYKLGSESSSNLLVELTTPSGDRLTLDLFYGIDGWTVRCEGHAKAEVYELTDDED